MFPFRERRTLSICLRNLHANCNNNHDDYPHLHRQLIKKLKVNLLSWYNRPTLPSIHILPSGIPINNSQNDSWIVSTRTRGISLQGETKFTWKRKREGACLLPTIFSPSPSPFPSSHSPRLVKWKKNGNVSRVTGCRSTPRRRVTRPSFRLRANHRDGPWQKSTWLLSRRKRYRFLRHGMHRETFIIPGYVTGSRDAAIRFAAT